jgi:hypothetical protein
MQGLPHNQRMRFSLELFALSFSFPKAVNCACKYGTRATRALFPRCSFSTLKVDKSTRRAQRPHDHVAHRP